MRTGRTHLYLRRGNEHLRLFVSLRVGWFTSVQICGFTMWRVDNHSKKCTFMHQEIIKNTNWSESHYMYIQHTHTGVYRHSKNTLIPFSDRSIPCCLQGVQLHTHTYTRSYTHTMFHFGIFCTKNFAKLKCRLKISVMYCSK